MKRIVAMVIGIFVLLAGAILPPSQAQECSPTRLAVGGLGRVLGTTPNRVRAEASLSGGQIGALESRVIFDVLDGPVCADGVQWWLVESGSIRGWTAESVNGNYLTEPVLAPTPIPEPTQPTNTRPPTTSPTVEGCAMFVALATEGDPTLSFNQYNFADQSQLPLTAPVVHLPAVSPDGQVEAFDFPTDPLAEGNFNDTTLYFRDAESGELTPVFDGYSFPYSPIDGGDGWYWVWSPEGEFLAGVVEINRQQTLVVISREGETLLRQPITEGRGLINVSREYWPTDRQSVVLRDEYGDFFAISLADGSSTAEMPALDETPLTPEYDFIGGEVFGDQTVGGVSFRIGFRPEEDGFGNTLGVYAVLPDGGEVPLQGIELAEVIFRNPAPRLIIVDASPDGESFIITNNVGQTFVSSTQRLPETAFPNIQPEVVWSQDGSRFLALAVDETTSDRSFIIFDAIDLREVERWGSTADPSPYFITEMACQAD